MLDGQTFAVTLAATLASDYTLTAADLGLDGKVSGAKECVSQLHHDVFWTPQHEGLRPRMLAVVRLVRGQRHLDHLGRCHHRAQGMRQVGLPALGHR